MDWQNQQFDGAAILQSPHEAVHEAVRSFAAESLGGWQIAETADGFEAKGHCGSHAATANFQIVTDAAGTKLAITLLVERAGPLGFMLFDFGGYYNGRIRHWLEEIQWRLHNSPSPAASPRPAERGEHPVAHSTRLGNCLGGCFIAAILSFPLVYGLCAVVGLLTGNLYVPGRGSSDLSIHGIWARVISGAILLILGWVAWRMVKRR